MQIMERHRSSDLRKLYGAVVLGGLLLAVAPGAALEPTPAAIAGFDTYISALESRLAQQHRSLNGFVAGISDAQTVDRLRKGELIIDELTPAGGAPLPGALLHDWRGTAFVRDATSADFERLMKDFSTYPRHFSPEVLQARVIAEDGDHLQATMRVRQHHVITVVMDTPYDITYKRLDAQHGYSISKSGQISEIEGAGTSSEHALDGSEEHGLLWRLYIYWSYEERDGGLYMQIESVSLTRSIPTGLGWIVGPFIQSIPRDSLEFTLRSAANGLRR